MKSVMVNQPAEILTGRLKGFSGLVVGFDAVLDEVDIRLDEHYCVSTS
jgi:hypothetical protein